MHKKITKAFKLLGFFNEITSNLKIVNFLDLTFNLENNRFKLFSKNNYTPTNINVNSNHPGSIIKHISNG